MLQDFKSVSDQFMTFRSKGLKLFQKITVSRYPKSHNLFNYIVIEC